MSDDPRDRKRPRHELDEELLVNHPTLYYDDGNTILKCEKTLFCAHRSILSNHSPVFRALLLPEIAHEKLRGLTLLEIDGERDEIEAFLNAIYNGINIAADFSTLTVENFPLLASIFRAAIGYGVPRMRDDVLTILRRQWPSSLTAHMAAYRAFKEKLQPEISGPNGTRVPNPAYDPRAADEAIVHPASVIAMLRKGKVADKQLLASLFYDLTRRVWQLGPPFSGYHLKSLPPDDIERLVYGSAALRAAHAHMASTFPPVQFPSPAHKQAHDTNHGHGFTSYWTTIVVPRLLHNSRNLQCEPIEDWDSAREITTVTLPRVAGNCPCAQETLQCISRSQEILWNNLATYFNLE